ncbi:hypothetical protein HPP92_000991 [Vanilla planifolia]|uniref:Uncharacterized protein n=1 Tax=Vanilla planifolia TaxID=51239 RepID=A0A835VHK3_VANPL|nr:hypothetical protein HPP92_000991 [Vanilla planifolia]
MAGNAGDESASQTGEESVQGKYGGIVPKKKPLISKDNERAYFDSADWVLGKQGANLGQKTRVAVESLRPKLQSEPSRFHCSERRTIDYLLDARHARLLKTVRVGLAAEVK